jgi:GalNAc-alpha-(1->4)-GalNAc-alpha-(1->3)-diNAcBac-PP-undecaprenol alpha-1,4-N-acetyl-D-galactosaminyltransferase
MINDSPSSLKICLVIHSLGIGGMERVMSIIANYIAEQNNAEVDLVLIGLDRNIEYQLSDKVQVHRPPFSFSNSRRTYDTVRTMIFLHRKLKELKPNCVLSFGEMWNNLVLISAIGTGCKVYISDRSKPGKDLGRLHNKLRDFLYPKASGYVAQTNLAAQLCRSDKWNENIKVIGNPINRIPKSSDSQKDNTVLFVGRLIKTKHVDQLIKIFHEIDNREWKLCIVGGDAKRLSLSKELDKLVKKLGVGEQILLEGEQHNMAQYYNRSKIFAFPSSSEGFPNVIGEALSAGLPVVAYDCIAGPSDMINDGENGFLIELFNKEVFKRKLKLLMKDEELREEMSRKAKQSISKFESNKIAEEFYNFITGSK